MNYLDYINDKLLIIPILSLSSPQSEMEKEYALKRASDTMKGIDLKEYSIKGNEHDWSSVNVGKDGIVSVKGFVFNRLLNVV